MCFQGPDFTQASCLCQGQAIKSPMISRPCSCGHHRRIISTSLSGLVPLLPTCFQLLLIRARQDHFTVWKFNSTEFQVGCQGFWTFWSSPFPRQLLEEVTFLLLSVRRFRPTGLPVYWQRAVLYTPEYPCQGIRIAIPKIGVVCLTFFRLFPGTSLTSPTSFLL